MTDGPPRVTVSDASHTSWRLPAMLRPATRAFAEALFLTEEGPPPAERLDWLMVELDDYLGHAGRRARLVFQSSVAAMLALAPLRSGRARPLTALSPADRVHAIEQLERSGFGLMVLAAKTILCFIWYEHPQVRASVGVDDGCLLEVVQ